MSITAKCLVESGYMPNTLTTVYTAGAGVNAIIDGFAVSNNSGSTCQFSVYLVPSGSSAGPANAFWSGSTISTGNLLLSIIQFQVLNPGDSIAVQASAANSVVMRVSGRECT